MGKSIKDFKNIYSGKSIMVLGNGYSLRELPYEDLLKCRTVGVNFIGKYFTSDFLVIADNLFNISRDKYNIEKDNMFYIKNSHSDFIFLNKSFEKDNLKYLENNYNQINEKVIHVELNKIENTNSKNYSKDKIYNSNTSVFIAASLAIYMGAINIGFVGFDFRKAYWDGEININKGNTFKANYYKTEEHLEKLLRFNPDINFYNFSQTSKFNSIKKVDWNEYKELFYNA